MKRQSKFDEYFKKVLRENMTVGSVGMGATGTQFSGDTYAPGDARIPTVIGQGNKKIKLKKKSKRSHKRRAEIQAGRIYDSNTPMIRRNKPERIAI